MRRIIKYQICFLVLGLVIFSCVNKNEKTEVVGNWWFVKLDSSYNELYIRDSSFVFMLDVIGGPGYTYNYSYKDDTMFVIDNCEIINKLPLIYHSFQCSFIKLDGEWLCLQKIDQDIDAYIDIDSSEDNYDKAMHGYFSRRRENFMK